MIDSKRGKNHEVWAIGIQEREMKREIIVSICLIVNFGKEI